MGSYREVLGKRGYCGLTERGLAIAVLKRGSWPLGSYREGLGQRRPFGSYREELGQGRPLGSYREGPGQKRPFGSYREGPGQRRPLGSNREELDQIENASGPWIGRHCVSGVCGLLSLQNNNQPWQLCDLSSGQH